MTMVSALSANAPQASSTAHAPLTDRGAVRGALVLTVASLAGFGFLYSLAGVGIGQSLFPEAARGSLIVRPSGQVAGSRLLAQPFAGDGYFQPRPSAAGYNPLAAAGSNQARTHPDLRKRLDEARTAVARREGVDPAAVPGELVTQSGGGLDPHLSPQAIAIQIDRVARARQLGREVVEGLVHRHTEGKQLGVLGQPRVNVLALNLALDALRARTAGQ